MQPKALIKACWNYWTENCLQDLGSSLNSLRANFGLNAIVVILLALSIGANTAIFSVIDDRLIKDLPVKNPDKLVLFNWMLGPQGNGPRMYDLVPGGQDWDLSSGRRINLLFSTNTFEKFRGAENIFEGVFASAGLTVINVNIDNHAVMVMSGQLVSGDFYRVLGITAVRGRTLLPEDDQPNAAPVTVISYRFWKKRFNLDPGVIGKTILINRTATTIVGVTPPDFVGTMQIRYGEDLTLPLAMAARVREGGNTLAAPGLWWVRIMGRLKTGISAEQARRSLEHVFLESARIDLEKPLDFDHPLLRCSPGGRAQAESDYQRDTRLLVPVIGMSLLVLLATCANVATLLLARGANRRREMAIRSALGAGRLRLVRQLMTESVMLALISAVLGLLFAKLDLLLFAMLFPSPMKEALANISLDFRALGFTLVLAVASGVLFSLLPSVRATRINLIEEFQGGTRSLGGGALSRLSQILVAGQVALSIVLLIGTGLFTRTLYNLYSVDLGFDRTKLLLFMIDAGGAGHRRDEFSRLHTEIRERIKVLPGVENATIASWHLLAGHNGLSSRLSLVQARPVSKERQPLVRWNAVGESYFDTYKIPVMIGRTIDSRDTGAAPLVAVVSQTVVNQFFGNENPIGRYIILDGEREIIGVVGNTMQTGYDFRLPSSPMVFIPFTQAPRSLACYIVRTKVDPHLMFDVIRKTVTDYDLNLALDAATTQEAELDFRLLNERVFGYISGAVGLLALVLSSLGLYGLMSYSVQRRTSEIGVRMAVGAMPKDILWMIIKDTFSIVAVGLVGGVLMAVAVTQLAASLLFRISPTDYVIYGAVLLFVALVALAACGLPAYRAAKVDPMIALRSE